MADNTFAATAITTFAVIASQQDLLYTAVGAASLGLVAVSAIPAFRQLLSASVRARGGYGVVPEPLFESKDGQATEESVAAFSDRKPRIAAWVALTFGFAASVAAAVVLAVDGSRNERPSSGLGDLALQIFNDWADVPTWAIVCIQCAGIPTKSQYDRRWMLANLGLLSAAVLLVSLGVRFGASVVAALDSPASPAVVGIAVCWLVELVAALAAALAFASFPHRPDVFCRGGLVDQQHAVSLLTRFAYTWNKLVFDISRQRQLQLEDLPNMDGQTRSGKVTERYLLREGKGRLWWRLVKAYRTPLAIQWVLTLVRAVLALFPQYVLYHFLERLEQPRKNRISDPKLWAWVVGLAASLLLQIWVSNAHRWLTSSRLEAPVNALVQSLVFQKALRLDEAAEPGQKVTDDSPKDKKDSKDEKESKKPKGDIRQAVVNHMKLDSGRMMIFCTYNYWFPLALFKLIFAGTFLAQLLGWRAFFAGLGSALFVLPVSHLMSRKYGAIQFGLMRYRDGKAHVLTEALHGMRQIKYSALEQLYEKKILQSRNKELSQFWRVAKWSCSLNLIVNLGPLLLSCVCLTVYAYTTTVVRASVIFASLGLFDQLDEAIGYLPIIQVYLMEAWTSCVRVEKYLNQPDKAPVAVPGKNITFIDATVRWPKAEDSDEKQPPSPGQEQGQEREQVEEQEDRSVLHNINLEFPPGELSIITGKTGAGKSLLLAAILGEVKLLSGTIEVPPPPPASVIEAPDVQDGPEWILPSLTAFVSQTPWIESGTLKDNITFGMPLREARYKKVLQACALEKDIELLVDGDQTEVGPKGVTLSGGQRWRVALARALYSRAGVLVLDDVLSAVDAHVGRIIVDQALTGELAEGRTRILATHHAEMCLPRASYLIRLDNGRLMSAERIEPEQQQQQAESSTAGSTVLAAVEEEDQNGMAAVDAPNGKDKKMDGKKKDEEESRETGRVKTAVYRAYIKASRSILLWLIVLGFLITSRFLAVARTWSLKELAESSENISANSSSSLLLVQSAQPELYLSSGSITSNQPLLHTAADPAYQHSVTFWIVAMVIFSFSTVLVGSAQSLLIMYIGLRASRVLFERMTHAILHAPLRWTDTVPTGRILNRFTSDTFVVDRRLASELGGFLQAAFVLIVIIGASLAISPYVLAFGIALLFLYGQIATAYISAAREVKRINSVAHSPVYDQFSSVLTGLSTVRAFRRTDFYMDRMFGLIDAAAKANWALQLLSRWMSFRMGMFGAVFVTAVAVCVTVSDGVDAALAGFGLVFALRYTAALGRLLGSMTSIELGFNAAERILEYIDIKTEPEGGDDAPAAWPSQGKIEVEDLTVAYSEELPAVLKDLNFVVQPGERIGVVGRTGAGKSTLAAVFFRLLEPRSGRVRIDGIDIATLKLAQLRARLAIIPQDPFLFAGTLRSNLDLDGSMDDYDLHAVLRRVHLVEPQTGDPGRPSAYPPVEEDVLITLEPQPEADETNPVAAADDLAPDANKDADVTAAAAALIATEDDSDDVKKPSSSSPSISATEPEADQPTSDSTTEVGSTTQENLQAPTPNTSSNTFRNLSTPISTGGANLSQGQRQLVCLARALLARPKVVVLDEATSAVDRGTDGAIQASLRREFAAGGCTVLVVAHRLSTVADFDRLLVLRDGRVAEMGSPAELLRRGMEAQKRREGREKQKEKEAGDGGEEEEEEGQEEDDDGTGAFWELVQKSAEREKLIEMILGDEAKAEAGDESGSASGSTEAS